MVYSGIGGQAVMEGVMMRNSDQYAIAVRLADGGIHVEKKTWKQGDKWYNKLPVIRGAAAFFSSLVMGMSTLMDSAALLEEEPQRELSREEEQKKKKKEQAEMATLLFAVVLAVVIFLLLPYYFSLFLGRFVHAKGLVILAEGVFRLAVFIGYVLAISLMEDMRRVFMYHGAEHKCINCIEHGMELTVENVRRSSRRHQRCGTGFLLFVLLISVVVFMFIRFDSRLLQLLCRLLLIPVIAGISYEFIRLAGRSENAVVKILSKPGLWLQGLTTREPDDAMIEVGMASVEAVFDWRAFQEEHRQEFRGAADMAEGSA